MHTLEKSIANKVRNVVGIVMTTIGIGVQDTILTEMENSVIPKVELAIKSVIASS